MSQEVNTMPVPEAADPAEATLSAQIPSTQPDVQPETPENVALILESLNQMADRYLQDGLGGTIEYSERVSIPRIMRETAARYGISTEKLAEVSPKYREVMLKFVIDCFDDKEIHSSVAQNPVMQTLTPEEKSHLEGFMTWKLVTGLDGKVATMLKNATTLNIDLKKDFVDAIVCIFMQVQDTKWINMAGTGTTPLIQVLSRSGLTRLAPRAPKDINPETAEHIKNWLTVSAGRSFLESSSVTREEGVGNFFNMKLDDEAIIAASRTYLESLPHTAPVNPQQRIDKAAIMPSMKWNQLSMKANYIQIAEDNQVILPTEILVELYARSIVRDDQKEADDVSRYANEQELTINPKDVLKSAMALLIGSFEHITSNGQSKEFIRTLPHDITNRLSRIAAFAVKQNTTIEGEDPQRWAEMVAGAAYGQRFDTLGHCMTSPGEDFTERVMYSHEQISTMRDAYRQITGADMADANSIMTKIYEKILPQAIKSCGLTKSAYDSSWDIQRYCNQEGRRSVMGWIRGEIASDREGSIEVDEMAIIKAAVEHILTSSGYMDASAVNLWLMAYETDEKEDRAIIEAMDAMDPAKVNLEREKHQGGTLSNKSEKEIFKALGRMKQLDAPAISACVDRFMNRLELHMLSQPQTDEMIRFLTRARVDMVYVVR